MKSLWKSDRRAALYGQWNERRALIRHSDFRFH
jgi:hypothetical protein